MIPEKSTSKSAPTSRATASNSSVGGTPCATSVATRRNRAHRLGGGAPWARGRPPPPHRRLLLREPVRPGMRLAQLGVDAAALGRVPSDAVQDAPLRHRARVPLQPPHRAVGADDANL